MITSGATPAGPHAEYRGLHRYLHDRFADSVVLTFAQIEDLLGFALPESAYWRPEWWADVDASGQASAQARSWTQAGRTAKPRMSAKTVVFDRAS